MRIALTIAGSDSIAGAGVQADLKTFAALGVYGVSAVTAVTSQSTTGVADVFALSADVVRLQIAVVAQDVEISAVKTGMLASAEIVQVAVETISRLQVRNVVVDPVMTASANGRTLMTPEAVSLLKDRLLPLAAVVTPNADEATILSGIRVDSVGSAHEAAKRIFDCGPRAVVVKGGHLGGTQAIDVLFWSGGITELAAPRSSAGSVHGTGCTFASAIAARLALGDEIPTAVDRAKYYVSGAIERSIEIGHGGRILNHFWGGLYS